jgi:hypothetical protein
MVFFVAWLSAGDGDRNFSGTWVLDEKQSDLRSLPVVPGLVLTVSQEGAVIHCVESDRNGKSRAAGTYAPTTPRPSTSSERSE